jgi:uncharacterized protein (TIGR04255 family)
VKQIYEDICYKRNFLTDVIARIDFVTPLSPLEKTLPTKFSDAVRNIFPIVVPSELVNFEVKVEVGVESARSDQTRIKQWQFFGKEREKVLSITSYALDVGYKQYRTYEGMKAEFMVAVDALARLCPDARIKRFGLRYINKISIEGSTRIAEVTRYIAPKLLCSGSFFKPSEKLTRLFHIAEWKNGDLDVRFQYGFPNPDYPAVMKRPDLILDLDCYVQVVHDLNETLRFMDSTHSEIQRIFESSISEALRKKMNA